MRNLATPFYGVPNDQGHFDFHMRTLLKDQCPGEKRLRRLFELYRLARDSRVEWTEYGYARVREEIEAYKEASEKVIDEDFRLLRKAYLVFVYGEKPSETARIMAELFGDLVKGGPSLPPDFFDEVLHPAAGESLRDSVAEVNDLVGRSSAKPS